MSTESIWSNVERAESLPRGRLIHPRVLDVPDDAGRTLVFACYGDVPSARALFDALGPTVEAAWLAELSSQPFASEDDEPVPPIVAMELFCFGAVPNDAPDGARAFGLAPTSEADSTRIPLLRGEASRAGVPVPEGAIQSFRARVEYTEASQSPRLRELTTSLRGETFGARPGALARALVAHFAPELANVAPDLSGLDAIEALLFTSEPDVVRGVSPILYPLLLDLVGVCLDRELDLQVGWAVPPPDGQALFEKALLQVGDKDKPAQIFHVGLELLRRCVMPRAADEEIAPLSEWLRSCVWG